MGHAYDGRTLYMLLATDMGYSLLDCPVEEGTLSFDAQAVGTYLLLHGWDALGVNPTDWTLQSNVLAGYMDKPLSENTNLTADDLMMLEALYRLTSSTYGVTGLLHADTGTTLVIPSLTAAQPRLGLTELAEAELADLPFGDGETIRHSGMLALTDGEAALTELPERMILSMQLSAPATEDMAVWTRSAAGEWIRTACVADAQGRLLVEVNAVGPFVITGSSAAR